MKKSRVLVLASIMILFFSYILYKLVDIQLISTEQYGPNKVNLLAESVEQRSSEMVLSTGRGVLLDRNNIPLNNDIKKDVVLFPFLQSISLPKDITSELTDLSYNWKQKLKNEKEPVYLSELIGKEVDDALYNTLKEAAIPGMVAVQRTESEDPKIATHLQGLVRSNPEQFNKRYEGDSKQRKTQPLGISGIEKTFDPFLLSEKEEKLMYHVDAKGNPLLGLDLRYTGAQDAFYPLKIQTTIDSQAQKMVEKVFEKYKVEKGGLVLLDIDSREVLSLVSKPNINLDKPYKNDSLKNQMLTTHFPGSVFKTVVAAAAIESDQESINSSYNCNLDLYGEEASERQLGTLTFEQSFAQSCNYTFAEIGNKLVNQNVTILDDYANKLGLLGPVGWSGDVYHYDNFSQLPDEEVGHVWGNEHDPYVEKAIKQTSIGQKEVKVTPLAMANMMATIASDGLKQPVTVVKSILYNNNTTMKEFTSNKEIENTIKPETAGALQKLLEGVVENGTGNRLKPLPIAGKSGTAQTGKEDHYNHWFVGYFPKDDPKYAMVVVDLQQTYEKAKTYDIYKEVASNLLSDQKK
ncbi:peptidoglycan D,D-transpeptidase FtsI family protein [Aquibacillus kalidii]|uniref:peptidoglycan D,D-transpeptidase FtsI family protein n=1 Tax=Aquibacillus kalidii TaxID=2762597 RepID=UPI0016487CC8|nr:penicillin-binding protein 2 [Aquibacillus kalidii]